MSSSVVEVKTFIPAREVAAAPDRNALMAARKDEIQDRLRAEVEAAGATYVRGKQYLMATETKFGVTLYAEHPVERAS